MHELGIASSIIENVGRELEQRPGYRCVIIRMRIGEMTAVDHESLRFGFDALTRDTDLEGVVLEIERVPRTHRCPSCGESFEVVEFNTNCPRCLTDSTIFVAGDELDIVQLELEERDGSDAGSNQGPQ